MNKEYKELLHQYLSMALPYVIYANLPNHHLVSHKYHIHELNVKNEWTNGILYCAGREQIYGAKIEDIKPYLRSMKDMTDEEKEEWRKSTCVVWDNDSDTTPDFARRAYSNYLGVVWLLKKKFDFMGLIEKGLAEKVTKENNPYERHN